MEELSIGGDFVQPTNNTPPPEVHDEDDFDLESIRLSQDFTATSAKKLLVTVPVRKPKNNEFVRTHPSPDFQFLTGLLEDDREFFIVDRMCWDELGSLIILVRLILTITRQNVPLLWPVKLPRSEGRRNTWNESAQEAANLAQHEWICIRANQDLGAYDLLVAQGKLPEPEWPAGETMTSLLQKAFKGRHIKDADHPVLRRLRGEI
jgi:hypothetical protein